MKKNLIRAVSTLVFFGIAILLLQLASAILRPYQANSLTSDRARSFAEEPKNTLEVIFVGSSHVADGFIPATFFETQGICSYNLGSSMQPLLASYLWTVEAYHNHPDTLKTVVLDVSMLRVEPEDSWYRLVLDEIPFADKLEGVLDWASDKGDVAPYLSPLYAYHSRWKELSSDDVEKLFWKTHRYLRGYEASINRVVSERRHDELLPHRTQADTSVEPTVFDAQELKNFERIVNFCAQHDLELLLIKAPIYSRWSDADHNAATQLAQDHHLTFLDLNYEPFFSETGYNQAIHTRDGYHANDEGAQILSSWLAKYLADHDLASDVRGDARYDFMEEQVENLKTVTSDLYELRSQSDPVSYLEVALKNPRYTVFVGMDDVDEDALSEKDRERLSALGLTEIAGSDSDDCAFAVVKDGKVIDHDHKSGIEHHLYSAYEYQHYMEPKKDIYALFPSSDARAIRAFKYAFANEDATLPAPDYYVCDTGFTICVYDDELEAMADYAQFKNTEGLSRYCYPQEILERYDTGVLTSDELPMPRCVADLKNYNEMCAQAFMETSTDGANSLEMIPVGSGAKQTRTRAVSLTNPLPTPIPVAPLVALSPHTSQNAILPLGVSRPWQS